jgi:hypothetical protein
MVTPILALTELAPSQAIPEAIVNENTRWLEFFASGAPTKDRDLANPTGLTPAEGDAYLIAASAAGGWAGHSGEIALWINGAWEYLAPKEGFTLYLKDEDIRIQFDGTNWANAAGSYTDNDARKALSIAPATLSGTTYTLVIGDAYGYLRATNASGCAITVPPNSSVAFILGTVITFRAATAGAVSLVAGAGVTLNPPGGAGSPLSFAEEGATVQIKKVGTDTWDVIGNTAA